MLDAWYPCDSHGSLQEGGDAPRTYFQEAFRRPGLNEADHIFT